MLRSCTVSKPLPGKCPSARAPQAPLGPSRRTYRRGTADWSQRRSRSCEDTQRHQLTPLFPQPETLERLRPPGPFTERAVDVGFIVPWRIFMLFYPQEKLALFIDGA